VSGMPFSMNGCSASTGSNCAWKSRTININGTNYTISAVNSASSIALSSSAGTQTGVSYAGPAWSCTDTVGDVQSSVQSVCMAIVTTGGSDTLTTSCSAGSSGCGLASQYVLIQSVAEFSNTNGVKSLDLSACATSNCLPSGGLITSGSNPSIASQVTTPGSAGELIMVVAGYGIGPVYTPSGWYGGTIGRNGASHSNDNCSGPGGNGYCANQAQTSFITLSSSGAYTAEQSDGASGDDYIINVLAFTAAP
jgi:hypothetical protein